MIFFVADGEAADAAIHRHRAGDIRSKSNLSAFASERVRMRRSIGACVAQSGTRGSPRGELGAMRPVIDVMLAFVCLCGAAAGHQSRHLAEKRARKRGGGVQDKSSARVRVRGGGACRCETGCHRRAHAAGQSTVGLHIGLVLVVFVTLSRVCQYPAVASGVHAGLCVAHTGLPAVRQHVGFIGFALTGLGPGLTVGIEIVTVVQFQIVVLTCSSTLKGCAGPNAFHCIIFLWVRKRAYKGWVAHLIRYAGEKMFEHKVWGRDGFALDPGDSLRGL